MLVLSLLLPLILGTEIGAGLTILDDMNFIEETKGKEALVLFYDPQCPSSKAAVFEFEKAAASLGIKKNFVMGEMNLLSNVHVPTAFKIVSNPTFLYIAGSNREEYKRTISSNDLLQFIERKRQPQLKELKPERIKNFLKPGIISFILFDAEDSKISRKIARSLRFYEPANIAVCSSKELAEELGLKWEGFYAVNVYHQIADELKDFSYEGIVDFVIKRDIHKKLPMSAAYDMVIERQLPAVYVFRNESDAESVHKVINETLPLLNDMRIIFADLNTHIVFSRILGLPAASQPAIMLIQPAGTLLHKYVPEIQEITKVNILGLIQDWKSKKAKRYYKNGPAIEGELNGENFDKTFEIAESDTLVHFYAPWCEHCKRLDKELEFVQQNLTNLKILRINAEDNEIYGHSIEEFPTLKFLFSGTGKWSEFTELKQGTSTLKLWERIVEFVKNCRKDRRSVKDTLSTDL